MHNQSLLLLSAADRAVLKQHGQLLTYRCGEILIAAGSVPDRLFLIQSGYVSIRQDIVTIAMCGPGETVGEMTFLTADPRASASASAVAETDVEVLAIQSAQLRTLLAVDTDFAARFFQALALLLSQRLLTASRRQNRLLRPNRAHAAETSAGELSQRLISLELMQELAQFRANAAQYDHVLADPLGTSNRGQFARFVGNAMIALLEKHLDPMSLLSAGYDDLLALRSTEQLEEGIANYIFRECFPVFSRSTTMARIYAKPGGIIEDHQVAVIIAEQDALGDGELGFALDQWFLARPICEARRRGNGWIEQQVAANLGGSDTFRLCDLACGPALAIFKLLATPGRQLFATCIDFDPEALRYISDQAQQGQVTEAISLICADALELPAPNSGLNLIPQHGIIAHAFMEYLDDDEVATLLQWAYDNLQPGGHFYWTHITPEQPDLQWITHILKWNLIPRHAEQLQALLAASPFAATAGLAEIAPGLVGVTCRR